MRAAFKTIGRAAPLMAPVTLVFCDEPKKTAVAPPKVAAANTVPEKEVNLPKIAQTVPEVAKPVYVTPPPTAGGTIDVAIDATADTIVDTAADAKDEDKDEDKEDAEWEEKKKHCSFCRHFLDSPCKLQFKGWSKCVEKCKEEDSDFVEICSGYTKELVHCTSSYPEYFTEPGEKADDSDVDEDAVSTDTNTDEAGSTTPAQSESQNK